MTDADPDGAGLASRRDEARWILLVGGALGVVAGAWLLFLRHRPDYPGHLLAGYGATLGAVGALALVVPAAAWGRHGVALVVLGTLACVAGGLVLEGTQFRMAAFDPVDAANQSVGAFVAGLSVLGVAGGRKPPPATVAVGALMAVAATAAGFLLASR